MEMKHPLENVWKLWFFTNRNKNNWEANLMPLTTFDTVEDYWCLYHYMKQPSQLDLGQDYMVFKECIDPQWEHDANVKGGRLCINLEKRSPFMDRVWEDMVLLMIGENFGEYNTFICGAFVNLRPKTSKVALWISTKREEVVRAIALVIKQQLQLTSRIQFFDHNSNQPRYTF